MESFINKGQMSHFQIGNQNTMTNNAINQLPSSSEPDKPGIKELLEQLKTAIESEPKLTNENKIDALEHIQTLAEAAQNSQESGVKKIAKAPIQAIQFIIAQLPDAAKLAESAKILIPMIAHTFGF